MGNPRLAFEVWKEQLREDCERDSKLRCFNALDDLCLRLLWETGVEPLVQAITKNAEQDIASQFPHS
jgi:hypothetical protein